jgi:hydroxyacylglutathione hydrolase
MKISSIPAGFDTGMNNLMWVINSINDHSVTIIDPGYTKPVLEYLEANALTVKNILITHHHFDHTDGVEALLEIDSSIPVYGPKNSPFKLITHPLTEDDTIFLENINATFKVIEVPGHTMDHISFYCEEHNICFVGDTVFGAGAGALFEGTADIFWNSIQKITNLPPQTSLYYGHDYTLENLTFACTIEKQNNAIKQRIQHCKRTRQNKDFNGYSTVELECQTNPFWRCHIEEVKTSCEQYAGKALNSTLEVFTVIRGWR